MIHWQREGFGWTADLKCLRVAYDAFSLCGYLKTLWLRKNSRGFWRFGFQTLKAKKILDKSTSKLEKVTDFVQLKINQSIAETSVQMNPNYLILKWSWLVERVLVFSDWKSFCYRRESIALLIQSLDWIRWIPMPSSNVSKPFASGWFKLAQSNLGL